MKCPLLKNKYYRQGFNAGLEFIGFRNNKPYWASNHKWQDMSKNVKKSPVKFYRVMIILNLALICLLALINYSGRANYHKEQELNAMTPNFAKNDTFEVIVVNNKTTFTAYTLSEDETDNEPCIGASNNNLCELKPILEKDNVRICASRDLPLDTLIYIEGFGECLILDRMNKRFLGTGRIDILMDTKTDAFNFGVRQLNYVIVK